ncbi:MAG: hypothetical protein WD356_05530 [Pseudomonadales bacterium]
MAEAVEKYLDGYAEPEAIATRGMVCRTYDYVLVIPACQERPLDLERVWQFISDDLLVILVVNSPREHDHDTIALLRHIQSLWPATLEQENLGLHPTDSMNPDIFLVDRCTKGRELPHGDGVGLARKIGADIALKLIVDGTIRTPVIYSTDADVRLPRDYFGAADTHRSTAATLYPFRHEPEPGLELSATLYEISMFYYVAGLKWAKSPYAFGTVGSTMAIGKEHYAMVRGFPKRQAGEDFYLLNKLAKTGNIRQLAAPIIDITARRSARAPFGTGANLAKIEALDNPMTEYRFYHPEIFRLLANCNLMLNTLWAMDDTDRYLEKYPQLRDWCEETGILQLARTRRQNFASQRTFDNFLHEWFDAFRTLKFIHFMRDRFYSSVPFAEIANAEFTPPFDSIFAFRDQLASICFDDRYVGITW